MRTRALLGLALIALVVGYVELRLPQQAGAQGRDAVYQRLAVSSTAANALRVAGGLEVGDDVDVADDVDVGGDLAVTGAVRLEAFRGLIAAFNGACPADWDEMTALRGRMIVGLVDGGELALVVGTALTNGVLRRGGTSHAAPAIIRSGGVQQNPIIANAFSPTGRVKYFTLGNGGTTEISAGSLEGGGALNQSPPAPYMQLRYCEYQP